jgi:uncharacterized protein (TIGR03382 family)
VDLVVRVGDTLQSEPGYPFLFTDDAADPGTGAGPGGRTSCNATGSAGSSLGLLLLALAAIARRKEVR